MQRITPSQLVSLPRCGVGKEQLLAVAANDNPMLAWGCYSHNPADRAAVFKRFICESAWKIDPHLGEIGVEK